MWLCVWIEKEERVVKNATIPVKIVSVGVSAVDLIQVYPSNTGL